MFSVCGITPSCKNHWVFNGKPVAISLGIKLMHHAQIVPAIHSLKKTGSVNPMIETAMPTVTLIEGCIFLVSICLFLGTQNRTLCVFSKPSKWKCASSENHTLCTVISSCSAHTANCSLCLNRQRVPATLVLYKYRSKLSCKVHCAGCQDIHNCCSIRG